MASPLASGLFHRAIGQSGAQLDSGSRPLDTLAQAETAGRAFAAGLGAKSLSELRAIPPGQLVKEATERDQWFWPVKDNFVFPMNSGSAQRSALINDVPLLTGWTSAEAKWVRQSPEEFQAALRQRFPGHLEAAAAHYPAASEEEALRMGATLESDFWLVHATWRWAERQRTTGTSPVYLYLFDQVQAGKDTPIASNDVGAAHASDIPFVFDTLDYLGNPVSPEDRKTSEVMMKYWARFARNGDPNIEGLPVWPPYTEAHGFPVMRFKSGAMLEPDSNRERQLFIKSVDK